MKTEKFLKDAINFYFTLFNICFIRTIIFYGSFILDFYYEFIIETGLFYFVLKLKKKFSQ